MQSVFSIKYNKTCHLVQNLKEGVGPNDISIVEIENVNCEKSKHKAYVETCGCKIFVGFHVKKCLPEGEGEMTFLDENGEVLLKEKIKIYAI